MEKRLFHCPNTYGTVSPGANCFGDIQVIKEHVIFLLVLVSLSLSLSGCLDQDDDDNNSPYIGSITIDDASARPVGLTRDTTNNLISTALGSKNVGEVWSVPYGSAQMSKKNLTGVALSGFSFGGSMFYDPNNYLYVCSNPTVAGIPPSVVVLKREDTGSYNWTDAINFPSNKQTQGHCYSVIRAGDSVLATNSVAGANPAVSFAVAYADANNLHAQTSMIPQVLYGRDLNYTQAELTGSNLVTDIKAAKSQPSGKISYYIVDSKRSRIYNIVTTLATRKVTASQAIGSDTIATTPTAMVQYSDKIFLVAQLSSTSNSVGSIYKIKFDSNKRNPVSTLISSTRSPVSALVIGSDYFGKTTNPVVFSLNRELGGLDVFSVDEFTFGENNPA